jgi:conjugative relaxase-like TrwC/TraI family protein
MGPAALGLTAEVDDDKLALLFDEGRHPLAGEPLGQPFVHRPGRTTVTGFALSFSPPKSVSLLWALGGKEVGAEIGAALEAAVASALSYLEDHAAFSRTGHAGVFQIDTEGYLAAAFTHVTSRAGDPQLHVHVLVSNKVRCVDGRWRALDGRELFAFQKAAGMLFNAALRAELTTRLGVEWEPVDRNGQADIAGVPKELIRRFSKRRADVQAEAARRLAEAEARLGRTLTDGERAEAYQRATYGTRAPKEAEGDREALRVAWATEAEALGLPASRWLEPTLWRWPCLEPPQPVAPHTVDEVVDGLAEGRSTWSRAEVGKAVARLLGAGQAHDAEGVRAVLEETSERVLAHPEVVRLVTPPSAEVPLGLLRSDGLPVHERHGTPRFSTRETFAIEARVLDFADRGREARVALARTPAVEAACQAAGLDAGQTAAVGRLCLGGEALACLVGPAGAGKTRSLLAARLAWSKSGVPVRGLAVSAVAAGVLGAESRLEAETLAKFLYENARPAPEARFRLRPGEVVVLDEAGMVASRHLAALVEAVERVGGKLVLVGDPEQLGSVGAGGLFRLLAHDARAVELTEVRRFTEGWEAKASLRLRRGDASVLIHYERHGRIEGGGREEMAERALALWRHGREGESVALLASDRATVEELAGRIRAERVAAGEVEAGGIAFGEQVIGIGDEVVTTRNDRRLVTSRGLWVRNGDRWVIEARSPDGALLVTHAEGRGRALLPHDYVADHVALAYALTVHRAQGLTVKRSVLLADARSSAEHLYVGLTRGRIDNRALVVCEAAWTGHGRRDEPTPVDVLRAAMRRTSAERSATEALRAEHRRVEDLSFLVPLLEKAPEYVDEHAGPDRSSELARLHHRTADRPILEGIARAARGELDRAGAERARAEAALASAEESLEALSRKILVLHREDRVTGAEDEVRGAWHWLERAQERERAALGRLARAHAALAQVSPESVALLESAIAKRREWLATHPADVEWLRSLEQRVAERVAELGQGAVEPPAAHLLRLIGRLLPDEPLDLDGHEVPVAAEGNHGRVVQRARQPRFEDSLRRLAPELDRGLDHGIDLGL